MMLRFALLASLLFALDTPSHAQSGDLPPPIAQAAQGKMQCHSPNAERKTCQSMATYRATANGGIENVARVLVLSSPAIVMTVTSQTAVRDAQVCGYVLKADLDKATFTLDGTDANPETTTNLRSRARVLYGSTLEREVCTAYKPDGDGFVTSVSIDGVPQRGASMRVIWVSPLDGYRVGP